ncbi:MAG: hypothetical protein WAO23_03465 [Dethiobacteria bacterium]
MVKILRSLTLPPTLFCYTGFYSVIPFIYPVIQSEAKDLERSE